jgi:RND family efflux transporter MFP subunit
VTGLVALAVLCGLLAMGILPRLQRSAELAASAKAREKGAVLASVVRPHRAPATTDVLLPGNIDAIEEASVNARASGYIKRRQADIGDRVREGQLLLEIDSPETDQQLEQARADLERSRSALAQARANLAQSEANLTFAKVTAQRFQDLEKDGVVSHQDADDKVTALNARVADVEAQKAAIAAAQSAIVSNQANVRRLEELQAFEKVTAPFNGIITVRNVDRGDLISPGPSARPMFKIARAETLRIFINVPQASVASVHVGQTAQVLVQELPNRVFSGKVARTANTLDPTSRTLLTEVHVENPDYKLLPGMFAQVKFGMYRSDPPFIVPDNTLVIRAQGPQVATVGPDGKVHFRAIQIGRDYGAEAEILSGLRGDESLIVNPSDDMKEGTPVEVTER